METIRIPQGQEWKQSGRSFFGTWVVVGFGKKTLVEYAFESINPVNLR